MVQLEGYYDKKVNNSNLKRLKLQATELKINLNYDTTLNISFDTILCRQVLGNDTKNLVCTKQPMNKLLNMYTI